MPPKNWDATIWPVKPAPTNDTRDAWFSGYGGHVVAVAWIGYDQNHSLGKKETGSRAALPIWRDFMKVALQNTPEVEYLTPAGVIAADIDSDGRLFRHRQCRHSA